MLTPRGLHDGLLMEGRQQLLAAKKVLQHVRKLSLRA
jgi:hypothetical protein